jgi:hypothetical protein
MVFYLHHQQWSHPALFLWSGISWPVQDFEIQIGCNHLAHFMLQQLLPHMLLNSAETTKKPCRFIVLSSIAAYWDMRGKDEHANIFIHIYTCWAIIWSLKRTNDTMLISPNNSPNRPLWGSLKTTNSTMLVSPDNNPNWPTSLGYEFLYHAFQASKRNDSTILAKAHFGSDFGSSWLASFEARPALFGCRHAQDGHEHADIWTNCSPAWTARVKLTPLWGTYDCFGLYVDTWFAGRTWASGRYLHWRGEEEARNPSIPTNIVEEVTPGTARSCLFQIHHGESLKSGAVLSDEEEEEHDDDDDEYYLQATYRFARVRLQEAEDEESFHVWACPIKLKPFSKFHHDSSTGDQDPMPRALRARSAGMRNF